MAGLLFVFSRAFPVNFGSPEMLQDFVFTALSDAEANPLRLEMLRVTCGRPPVVIRTPRAGK
jgi:hypothetical protein